MTPMLFLQNVARPNLQELRDNPESFRHACNAVASADALMAHMYQWLKANNPPAVADYADDTAYRAYLAQRHDELRLLRDMAKVLKHGELVRNPPPLRFSSQVLVQPRGYGRGPYTEGLYGGPPEVTLEERPGDVRVVAAVLEHALIELEGWMTAFSIP